MLECKESRGDWEEAGSKEVAGHQIISIFISHSEIFMMCKTKQILEGFGYRNDTIFILEGYSKATVITDYEWLCVLEGNGRRKSSRLGAIAMIHVKC